MIKCNCSNMENGSIITTNKEGQCIVCGTQFSSWNTPSSSLEDKMPTKIRFIIQKFEALKLDKDAEVVLIEDEIKSQLSLYKQEIRKEMLEKVKELTKEKYKWDNKEGDGEYKDGYNQAIEDITNLISRK